MVINNLHDKFTYELKSMYYVERRLLDVLDEMARDVANDEFREGLERHREETQEHVRRLEDVFDAIDEPPREEPSHTFDALIEEREEMLGEIDGDEDMHDLCDLGIAAKNEHMEIAGYENLIMLARKLDLPRDVRNALDENLEDEQETKKQLKAMADDSTLRKIFARLAG